MNPSSRNDFTGYNEAHALIEDGIENCGVCSGSPKEQRAGELIANLLRAEKVLKRYGLDDSWCSRCKKPKLRQVVRSYILDDLKMNEAALRALAPQLWEPFVLDAAAALPVSPEAVVVTKKKAEKKLMTEKGMNYLSLDEGRDDTTTSQIFVDAESMIIFDVLAQLAHDQHPNIVVSKDDIDLMLSLPTMQDQLEALARMPTVSFTDADVRAMTGLDLTGWEIKNLVMKAKSALMVVTTKQKVFWEKGHWHHLSSEILSSLGDIRIEKDGVTIHRDDIPEAHRIKHRYTICFNTVLGAIFLSNLSQRKYRLLPQSFYKLPPLYQMLYRIYIAYQKRGETVRLPYSRACRLLGEPEVERIDNQKVSWEAGLKKLKEMKLLSDGSKVEGRGKKTCLELR